MTLVRLLVLLTVAFASVAHAAIVGSGDSIAIAGGNGVDLLVWRDGAAGRIKAVRFDGSGTPLDASPLELPLPPGHDPSAAWDGSGFLVTIAGSNTLLARLPVTGGAAFTLAFASSPPADWSTVASKKDGTSLLVWSAGSGVFTASVAANGDLVVPRLLTPGPYQPAKLVREADSYLLAWFVECRFPVCPPEVPGYLLRFDDVGNPVGPFGTFSTREESLAAWSFAEGSRALLTASSQGTPSTTRIFSIDPGALRAAQGALRFPEALVGQKTAPGQSLVGLGARIDASETGAPLTVGWAPLAEGMRLAGVLPSSGARVLAPASGTGPISIEMPAADSIEVGLAPVFVSPSTVWLKVDNRGPDAARLIDVWVTAPVQSFSSLVSGTITRAGALSRLRFQPNLKQGAGFEIAMYFEQPIDAQAFEAWALTLGTDRDATNNYVSTRVEPVPPPERPRRRRLVGRP